MLHQVGVSFDLYYDARKHRIKTVSIYLYAVNTNTKCSGSMPFVRIFIIRTHSAAHVNYRGERESVYGTLANVVQEPAMDTNDHHGGGNVNDSWNMIYFLQYLFIKYPRI